MLDVGEYIDSTQISKFGTDIKNQMKKIVFTFLHTRISRDKKSFSTDH